MSSTARVPVRALRAIADAVSAERSTSYATTEVGRAALLVALRDQAHASPALAAQLARVQADTPMSTSIGVGPGASVVHNAGPVFRAAYLIRAAQRIGAAADPATQTAAEQRYLRQHQNAQMARELGAMRMDAARAAYGRTLGWYSRNDDRVTAECRAANGKNFDPTHPPGIGLPGIGPHVGCRCTPGPPHEGAAFMPGAPSNVTALPGTTVREPAHLPGDDVISASVELVSGDTSPFSSSTSSNWVAKAGGLPGRVRAIARAVKRRNPSWPLSRCIAVAVNAVKHSAATGDVKGLPGRQNERPDTVAAHGAAAARWSAMKASTHTHTAEGAPVLDLAKKAAKPKPGPGGTEVEGDGLTYDPASQSFHPTTKAEGDFNSKHPRVGKGNHGGGQFTAKQKQQAAAQKKQQAAGAKAAKASAAGQKKQAAANTKTTKQQAAAQKKAAAATVATAKAKTAAEKKAAAAQVKAARAALAAAKASAPKKATAPKKTAAPKATAPKSTSTTTTKVTTGPKGTTQTTTRTVKATAPTATAIGLAYGPLVTTTMMKDAIACVPRAKDPAKAKTRCVALAKRHGLTRMLPAAWVPADVDVERPETD